jgi:hypothetical protein
MKSLLEHLIPSILNTLYKFILDTCFEHGCKDDSDGSLTARKCDLLKTGITTKLVRERLPIKFLGDRGWCSFG